MGSILDMVSTEAAIKDMDERFFQYDKRVVETKAPGKTKGKCAHNYMVDFARAIATVRRQDHT
jgi:hypothetical protein